MLVSSAAVPYLPAAVGRLVGIVLVSLRRALRPRWGPGREAAVKLRLRESAVGAVGTMGGVGAVGGVDASMMDSVSVSLMSVSSVDRAVVREG